MTRTIFTSPPSPINPANLPMFITICVTDTDDSFETVVTLRWDPIGTEPTELEFSAESPCTKLYIPAGVSGLVAECAGAQALLIV